MSYILDALKKSEQERNKGKIPTIGTVQDIHLRKKRSSGPPWLLIGVSALLLNALLFGIWMHSEKDASPLEHDATAVLPADTGQTESPREVSVLPTDENTELASLPADAQAPVEITSATDQKAATITPEQEMPYGESEAENVIPPEEVRETPQIDSDPVGTGPEAETSDTAAAVIQSLNSDEESPVKSGETEDKLADEPVPFDKLSSRIKATLPEIKISLHYYSSDNTSSKVSINGRMMREGYEVESGLVIQEITQDGVLFSYQDTLFSYEVFTR